MKINLYIFSLILLFLGSILLSKASDINYQFTQTDSSYSFIGSFMIDANSSCLLNIFFQYNHIKTLAPDAKVVLISKGLHWNKIEYTYRKFIYFESKSTWHRNIDNYNNRVDFKLISNENNQSIMPKMLSSFGYYKIQKIGTRFKVTYYQKCVLTESSLTKLYLKRVKNEAIEFIYRLKEYSEKNCLKS